MSEWEDCVLANICHYVKDRRSTDGLSVDNYISTENLLPNKGGYTTASSVPEGVQVTDFCKGDVLVSNIRPYFKKIWQATFDSGCSNDVLVFRAEDGVDPRWLNYVLANDRFFDHCMAGAKGCKMPRGDKQQIMEYPVNLPDLPTQRKIAAVLGALDDKIELNRKMNANLEAMAQALFKSWFVDFEPFGGKMPEGWRIVPMREFVCSMLNGDWGKDAPEGKNQQAVYCIRGADIPEVARGNKGKMPKRFILKKNLTAKKLVDGDLVVEISGGSPTQSTGRVALVTASLLNRYDADMVCTNFCKAVKPIAGMSYFLYVLWKHMYERKVFFRYENGTTGIKNLDIQGVLDFEEFVLPDEHALRNFADKIAPLYDKIFTNGKHAETLAQLRDALLPKLMSGELDVEAVKVE